MPRMSVKGSVPVDEPVSLSEGVEPEGEPAPAGGVPAGGSSPAAGPASGGILNESDVRLALGTITRRLDELTMMLTQIAQVVLQHDQILSMLVGPPAQPGAPAPPGTPPNPLSRQ